MAYTNIDDPSAYFTTTLWTGAGGSPRAITNDANSGNFQPDFIWSKGRNEAYEHQLYDSSRGAGTNKGLTSNDTSVEGNYSATYGYLSSFDSNGFTGTAGTSGQNAYFDTNAKTYVAWQWKANGGTTSSLSNTGPDSVVQVNSDAKFSIGTYTGNGSNSNVKHGLGETPDMLIVKRRNGGTGAWAVWHKDITSSYWLRLDTNVAQASGVWDGLDPTSEKFFITGGHSTVNVSGSDYVFYAWKSVQGYSKFGKYIGNGFANGPFVYTGFKPAFVLVKNASASESWVVYDTTRNTYNLTDLKLSPDTIDFENNNSGIGGTAYNNIDILSNGFKCRSNNAATNGSGNTIIYMAFAENPFVTSTGVPTTAR